MKSSKFLTEFSNHVETPALFDYRQTDASSLGLKWSSHPGEFSYNLNLPLKSNIKHLMIINSPSILFWNTFLKKKLGLFILVSSREIVLLGRISFSILWWQQKADNTCILCMYVKKKYLKSRMVNSRTTKLDKYVTYFRGYYFSFNLTA